MKQSALSLIMAFRGSLASSIFSSSSLGNSRSQNNSASSLFGSHSKPRGVLIHTKSERQQQQHESKTKRTPHSVESSQEDLYSYLSSFDGSKSTTAPGTKKHQKDIDWEKLVETSDAPQNLGLKYEAKEYSGFEELSSDDEEKRNNFLKTIQSTKTRHNETQKMHNKQQSRLSTKQVSKLRDCTSVGNKLSDLKYVRGSTDFVSTCSDEDESISITDSESHLSTSQLSRSAKQTDANSTHSISEDADDTDSKLNPLAHVKVARLSDLTFSDNTDTTGAQHKQVRQHTKTSDSEHSESHFENELLKEFDTDLDDLSISEPLNLRQNVFSIDELNGITPESDPLNGSELSISNDAHSPSDSNDAGPSNIRNVFSIDDLEVKDTNKEGSVSTKAESSKKQVHDSDRKKSSRRKESSEFQTGHSFKFSATSSVKSTKQKNSPVASDTEQSIKDSVASEVAHSTEQHGYSDDEDFESESLSEEQRKEITSAGMLSERDNTISHHHTVTGTNTSDSARRARRNKDLSFSGAEDEQENSELTETTKTHHTCTCTCTCGTSQNLGGLEPHVNVDSYIWPKVVVGAHYGKVYLDPSPILPHVVPADTLEVLTAYSPSMVALTDMLRAQLHLTRQLVVNSRQVVENVSSNISADYHYTTLEETKQYIAKHRPKVISTAEAMQQVDDEFVS